MNPIKLYKIKVGIEEFPVKEEDVPRVTQAMQTNALVKLDCGIFRGSAILSVSRDLEKEARAQMIVAEQTRKPTLEELQDKQRQACEKCEHRGYVFITRGNEPIAKQCECQIVRELITAGK